VRLAVAAAADAFFDGFRADGKPGGPDRAGQVRLSAYLVTPCPTDIQDKSPKDDDD
jgi:hypothetical protein